MSDTAQAALCRNVVRDDDGAVQVEVAISYTLIFLILAGVIQFCMIVYGYAVYAEAARVGVRYAVQHGTDSSSCSGPSTGCADSSGANVVSAVNAYAAQYVATDTETGVQTSYPDSSSAPGARVIVTVNYSFLPFFTYKGFSDSFQIQSQGRILY